MAIMRACKALDHRFDSEYRLIAPCFANEAEGYPYLQHCHAAKKSDPFGSPVISRSLIASRMK